MTSSHDIGWQNTPLIQNPCRRRPDTINNPPPEAAPVPAKAVEAGAAPEKTVASGVTSLLR